MAATSPKKEFQCKIFAIEFEPCGHVQKLDFVNSDCNYPNTLDHTDHPKVFVKVDAFTPCHFCSAETTTTPELKARVIKLEDMLQQHVTAAGFEEPHTTHASGSATSSSSQQTNPIDTREELQRRISNMEGLLAGGFGVSRTTTATTNINPSQGYGYGSGSSSSSSTPYTTPTPTPTPSTPTISSSSSTTTTTSPQAAPRTLFKHPPPPRPHILRGQSGIRREFFPGVNWEENRLSRKETAKRRDWLRRIYPHGLPIRKYA
ncbi:hypothetical protein N7G274_005336 [Stereocaulon virgatum]|uniref:Uncharacterized protein n=1 Tax=Stereocaulon virgatum TaxID=373712 RepID=A0ABR4A8Z7_9LECA